ncbi:hypothetical protein K505DRAFT_414497 [Melanomma pulvis-pyrius CBS 109.77]|uniref:Uncharacterized protein n=1 Tax=Melanomma pulvis-pyrius CBS 109.77 TaxID=1314802 RepID=A0A6A6XPX8_9PLEO|nr:hypothetical protein K505DRAFT_414497 [Melanomma pulvis-pyrius CBS 109.77]
MRFYGLVVLVASLVAATVATDGHECNTVTATVTVTVDTCKTAPPVVPPPGIPTTSGNGPAPPTSVPGKPTGSEPSSIAPVSSVGVSSTGVTGVSTGVPSTVVPPVGTSVGTSSVATTGEHHSATGTTSSPPAQSTNAALVFGPDVGMGAIAVAGVVINAAMALVV